MPEPSPVWFYWDGATILIYSMPGKTKLKAIAANPHVALNFDGDTTGGDIVVLTGEARVDPAAPPAHLMPEYLAKYLKPIAEKSDVIPARRLPLSSVQASPG